jgi:hypothetical protein
VFVLGGLCGCARLAGLHHATEEAMLRGIRCSWSTDDIVTGYNIMGFG